MYTAAANSEKLTIKLTTESARKAGNIIKRGSVCVCSEKPCTETICFMFVIFSVLFVEPMKFSKQ